MGDDWMTPEHKRAALAGQMDLVRGVVANAPTELLATELRRRVVGKAHVHDYDVISAHGEPVLITCGCGGAWDVKPVETSTAAEPRSGG